MTEKKYYEVRRREIPPVPGLSKKPMKGLFETEVINPDVEMTQADHEALRKPGAFFGGGMNSQKVVEPETLPDAYSGFGESKLIGLIRECLKYLKGVKAEEYISFHIIFVDGTVSQLCKLKDPASQPPGDSIFMEVPSYKPVLGDMHHPVSLAASVVESCIYALRGLHGGDGLKGTRLFSAMDAYRTYEKLIFALRYEPYVVAGMEQVRKKQEPNKKAKAATDQLREWVKLEAQKLRKINPELYKKDTEAARKIMRDYPDRFEGLKEGTVRKYLNNQNPASSKVKK